MDIGFFLIYRGVYSIVALLTSVKLAIEWRHQVKADGMTICKFPNHLQTEIAQTFPL